MKIAKYLGGAVAGALLFTATAQTGLAAFTSEQRLTDFNQLVSIIERNYGPLRWKKHSIGLDWKKQVAEYKEKALSVQSDAAFYRLLSEFLTNLKDAHVSAKIPSNYRARLGFLCDYVEGKVLIETIDTLRLPGALFPFKKGDQLLELGGVPVEDLMTDLAKTDNTGNELSTKRIAAARLTSRREASGNVIPKGVTTITVLPQGAAEPVTVTATWIISGEPLLEMDDLSKLLDEGVVNSIQTANDMDDLTAQLKKLAMFNLRMPQNKLDEWSRVGIQDVGASQSMFTLPEGARVLDGFGITAAIYEAGGKKIGILRIPSYTDDKLLQVLARAIMTLENETDVLVLDQTNNPGGSVALVSDIISLFAEKSYKDMVFEIRPSLNWLTTFQGVNDEIANMLAQDPNSAAANAMKARFDYLQSEIRESLVQRKFATNPVSLNLFGTFGMIQPQPMVHYSKPVLMLINEFDFSGGDAMPALLKDNGRVTLFGERTSGAGGNVSEYGPLANTGFKFSLTESLMVRPNGNYVENVGVSPDVQYTVTTDDFMSGYKGYVRAFTTEALKLVGVDLAAYEAQEKAEAAASRAALDALSKRTVMEEESVKKFEESAAAKQAAEEAAKKAAEEEAAKQAADEAASQSDAAPAAAPEAPATDEQQ